MHVPGTARQGEQRTCGHAFSTHLHALVLLALLTLLRAWLAGLLGLLLLRLLLLAMPSAVRSVLAVGYLCLLHLIWLLNWLLNWLLVHLLLLLLLLGTLAALGSLPLRLLLFLLLQLQDLQPLQHCALHPVLRPDARCCAAAMLSSTGAVSTRPGHCLEGAVHGR
jgi:hypothetical protein